MPLVAADNGQVATISSTASTSSVGSSGTGIPTIIAYPYVFSLADGNSYNIPGSDFSVRLTNIESNSGNTNQNLQSQTIDVEICLNNGNSGTCGIYNVVNIGQTLTQDDGNTILKFTALYIDENNYVHFKYGFDRSKDVNTAPIIDGVSGPQYLTTGEQGTWSINAHDDGKILSYNVDWGETPQYQMMTTSAQETKILSQTSTFTHSYTSPGDYTVVFTVTDQNGQSAKSTITVHVTDGLIVPTPQPVPDPLPVPSDRNAKLKSLYSQLLDIIKQIIDLQNSTN